MFVEHKPLTLPRVAEPRTAAEVLLTAAKFLEEHGWSPRGHEQAQDRYCAIEAISEVSQNQSLRDGAYEKLRDANLSGRGIIYWNAHSTEDEVVATMRKAATV
jgi:hypothetical protein